MSIKTGLEYVGCIDPWTDKEWLSDEEIVRCRDCKYARIMRPLFYRRTEKPSADIEEWYWYCQWHSNDEGASDIEPDGFCAWGERKEADE